jgi:homoserine kinase type II
MWVRRAKAEHCAQVGEALARLHVAGNGFPLARPNALSVAGWRPLYEQCGGRADEVLPGLGAEIEHELAFLEANWPRSLPEGIIHADLFQDNVFFLGGSLSGLIEFYFACNDMRAYDVAFCLIAWCFEIDGSVNVTGARALLSGYAGVRAFGEAEVAALPLLARGSALRFLLTRLYDWLSVPDGAMVTPKDPLEFYRRLRFHRSVTDASAYGLTA